MGQVRSTLVKYLRSILGAKIINDQPLINNQQGFGHVNEDNTARTMGACSGPVRSEPVQNPFNKNPGPPNREPDHRSGSSQTLNLGPNHGQVRLGSGSNHGSELNLSISNTEALVKIGNFNEGVSGSTNLHAPSIHKCDSIPKFTKQLVKN